jgi:ubiquinone biosynthesis monooxygenase Coq7
MVKNISSRQYSFIDRAVMRVDTLLRLCVSEAHSIRPYPAADARDEETFSPSDYSASARLMRVNHSGEVCAQALYQGQALTSSSDFSREMLLTAASEERDHLAWCSRRLQELNDHTSYLNPFWYAASFGMGAFVGCFGERFSLGFVHATEQQVELHLNSHLTRLSQGDERSRAIIIAMRNDERHHGHTAIARGGEPFPEWGQTLMRFMSRPMTTLSYWI